MSKVDQSTIKSLFELYRTGDYRALLERTRALLEINPDELALHSLSGSACLERKSMTLQSAATRQRCPSNRISPRSITAWGSPFSAADNSRKRPAVFTMPSDMTRSTPRSGSISASPMKTGSDCRRLPATIRRPHCSTRFITRLSVHLRRCCGNYGNPIRLRCILKRRWPFRHLTCPRTWG